MKNSDEDDFMSNIFIRPKKNRKQRDIKSSYKFNISKDCNMASIDLQDAYYSCKVNVNDRKFFLELAKKYQYTCLAMGLASAPRIFTKLMKPAFLTFRKQGFSKIAYIDDITFKCL